MYENIRLKLLDLGEISCKRKELIQSDADAKIISPMEAVLIWHPEIGYILYDTGNAVDWENVYSEHIKSIYPISRLVYIKEALAK